MKKTYHILAIIGAVLWVAAIFLRDSSIMTNLLLRRIIWVLPNFGVVWVGIGLTIIGWPFMFKKDFDLKKFLLPLLGIIFMLLILSEVVHNIFFNAGFDIWDMGASLVALLVILVIHLCTRAKS